MTAPACPYLAIDPGLDTGWALFRSAQELVACGLGDASKLGAKDRGVRTAIIERPKVYRALMSKGDPNDLITLAIQVGRYSQHLEERGVKVAHVLPQDWKGQQPKEVTQAQAERSLSLQERGVVADCMKFIAKSKQHNVWDAIALGRAAFAMRLWA